MRAAKFLMGVLMAFAATAGAAAAQPALAPGANSPFAALLTDPPAATPTPTAAPVAAKPTPLTDPIAALLADPPALASPSAVSPRPPTDPIAALLADPPTPLASPSAVIPTPLTDSIAAFLAASPAPTPDAAPAAAAKPAPAIDSPTFSPDTLAATQKAAQRYADIAKAGGWPTDLAELHPRAIGPDVAKLRKRLMIEGDLEASAPVEGPAAQIWDKTLASAVKRFQTRMGLKETGIVAGATLQALNVPAEARAQALAKSAERLSTFNFGFGERYVVVNLPSASVEAVENGVVVHRYAAIVGDPDHASPEIAAHVLNVNLNPTWTVPVSIIKNEIIPRMQRDPGYLAREKIRILNASGVAVDPKSIDWTTEKAVNYTLRQDSGAGNSLGTIRIDMPNKHAVYMHDTPSKRLFGADYRFLSHGCVRVQGVYDFAEWLLEGTAAADGGAYDKLALTASVKTGQHFDIRLVKAVPVIWTYLTGWANDDGSTHFRDDVYGLDNAPVPAGPADVTAETRPANP
jgi:murein L,D-transpeptidase YcbB/YkuD